MFNDLQILGILSVLVIILSILAITLEKHHNKKNK